MAKNKNRRGFFRIYDEVNLFYQKIDEKLLTEPLLPKLEKNLPEVMTPGLHFDEHETRNVNISASGMAFNCEEALKEGDYLAIKMQLVSGMPVIVTYGQVVYCNNSQLNDSQYPNFVGAHFINMKAEDRELLIEHVSKKRSQQIWINGFILAVVITVITAPDVVFGLASQFLHFLLELFLHTIHLGFEFIESSLDKFIEHLFHTDLHQTQVIVFYIILSFGLYGLYRLLRAAPPFFRQCKKNQINYWSRQKASLLYYWREQSLPNKITLAVIGAAAITCYVLFGF